MRDWHHKIIKLDQALTSLSGNNNRVVIGVFETRSLGYVKKSLLYESADLQSVYITINKFNLFLAFFLLPHLLYRYPLRARIANPCYRAIL
jgi:hypothetical protein